MLGLELIPGESIVIGDPADPASIVVRVAPGKGSRGGVKLGVSAPAVVPIFRDKIIKRDQLKVAERIRRIIEQPLR